MISSGVATPLANDETEDGKPDSRHTSDDGLCFEHHARCRHQGLQSLGSHLWHEGHRQMVTKLEFFQAQQRPKLDKHVHLRVTPQYGRQAPQCTFQARSGQLPIYPLILPAFPDNRRDFSCTILDVALLGCHEAHFT